MNRTKNPEFWRELGYFIDNVQENLVTIEKELLSLESLSIPEQMTVVWKIFYANYWIRVNANILNNNYIQETLYFLENALLSIKENRLKVDQNLVSLILKLYDIISLFFEKVKNDPESIETQVITIKQSLRTSLTQLISYLQDQKKQQLEYRNNIENQQFKKSPNDVKIKDFNLKEKNTISPQLKLDKIVQFAIEQNLTDIYLGNNEPPRFRNYQGKIILGKYPKLTKKILKKWLDKLLTQKEIELLKKHQDIFKIFDYSKMKVRLRFHIFNNHQGIGMIWHLIPQRISTLEELSLPLILKDLSRKKKGLILITGAANSGKSTTVAAMLDYINKNQNKYILTLETLIEFVHQSHKSLVKQIQIDQHLPNYNLVFTRVMRHNPHVIFMDSLENPKSINMALKAVARGCLVIGNLGTNTVIETFLEITSFYSSESQEKIRTTLAKSLLAIVSQGLCPNLEKKQTPYYDIWLNTATMKDYIVRGKFAEILPLMEQGQFLGMTTMNQSLLKLYQQGKITEETALEKSPIPYVLARLLRD